jgi:signal transduction histidine kinase
VVVLGALVLLAVTAFSMASFLGTAILVVGFLAGGAAALSSAAVLLGAPTAGPGLSSVLALPPPEPELERLAHARDVLAVLHEVSRTLPPNLDPDELLIAIEALLVERFGAQRLAVLTVDESRWYPQLVRALDLGSDGVLDELPAPLADAALELAALRIDDLEPVCGRGGSGLYARLVVEGTDLGLLAIEHPDRRHFDDRAVELFEGVCELVALGIENARSFSRLRSLAAAEERARIARDLHDRLGQWLTYINLELERVNGSLAVPHPELARLQGDVRSAIDELREALVELRTTTRSDRPLSVVLAEVVQRFAERTGLHVELSVPDSAGRHFSALVEDELLRIAQESLTNIEKHADATAVHINWSVDGSRGLLTIEDNGRGFDPARRVRSTAYGLVGMRERAAAVGAILQIASQRGTGTVVTVLVGTTEECRQ